ncbi:MAG: hypothetical protein B6D64_06795 [Bacteroidetes bacterium 4484_276]|nr:MAG: hypothetical protein B6D64_06795 [Bacteroidetes bacterium 4484_276]
MTKLNYAPEDCKILVVDDLSTNIQMIGKILLQENYQVSFALSGKEALSVLDKNSCDLILLDILMPGMDGYEVCDRIKSNDKTKNIPIIFLTAKTDSDSIIKGFKYGAVDYVGKPFFTEELLSRIKTQLRLKKQNEQLESWNNLLEDKIKERTSELQSANEELALLEKAKNNFLMLISHELRTPLNAINGFTELLHSSLKSSKHSEAIKYLKQSSEKLIALADSALLITELQSGSYLMDFSRINLREMCELAIAAFSDDINNKSIKIISGFDEGSLDINGDYNLVLCCIRNLMHNAIKYSPAGGSITLKTSKANNHTLLEISDTGPGFPKEELGKLFRLFGKEEKDFNEGFGLDLATAKLIMDIHSGKISAENLPGGGAMITLSFPN